MSAMSMFVLLKDQHQGYICWDDFERSQEMLADDHSSLDVNMAPAARHAGN